MPIFTAFSRRRSTTGGETPGRDLPEEIRQLLPVGFEAVGEALASTSDTGPACSVTGRSFARDGAGLGEALESLRVTFDLVRGIEPDFTSVEALGVAWSEATLEFLHGLSCEDPLTGMASLAHVRTRLDELYRESDQSGDPVQASHALVVIEMTGAGRGDDVDHQFTRALHRVQVTEAARMVFSGGETIGRAGQDRALVVTRRTQGLGRTVGTLRELLGDLDLGGLELRVWIEGLPVQASSATRLLDELARTT